MKKNITEIIPSFLITLILLLVLDIVCATIFPLIGFVNFRLPFNILIVLYMGFKLEHPTLAILIMILQYTHSFFTIESWAMGTAAGIVVWTIVSYVRDLLHFSSKLVTSFVTEMFQLLWFVIVAILLYVKLGTFDYILAKFWRFIPSSLIISLLAPYFFSMLDRIWGVGRESGMLGDVR